MLEIGTQVEYLGEIYTITRAREHRAGQYVYALKSTTGKVAMAYDSQVRVIKAPTQAAFAPAPVSHNAVASVAPVAPQSASVPLFVKQGGYLYLNFCDNLTQGSKNKDDFYTSSLTEQYDAIRRKLGKFAPDTLQAFIAGCFPIHETTYYISMPAFERSVKTRVKKDGTPGVQYINNVVIRPDLSGRMARIGANIPPQFDVILVGDITFGAVYSLTIKGLELIDSSVAKSGECKLICTAACAYTQKNITTRTGSFTAPDYGEVALKSPVITRDFIDKLCAEVYPIPNPTAAIKVFEDWKRYIAFRKYYLGVQSSKCEAVTDVTVKAAYMVSKALYKKNEDSWHDLLLDGHEELSRGEQVVLSREVAGADEFPLICVAIEKNRHEVLLDTIGKGPTAKPRYEVYLRRYTRDSMGLSPAEPKYDERGNITRESRFSQFVLGERFSFTITDIEPDCSALVQKSKKEIDAEHAEIDKKYLGIIMGELERFIAAQAPILTAKYERLLGAYAAELAAKLESDVSENKDKEIRRQIADEIARLSLDLTENYKKAKKQLDERLKAIDKDKTLSKADKKQAKSDIHDELTALEAEYKKAVEAIEQSIDVAAFYVARNTRLVENKRKSLAIDMQSETQRIRADKKKQLELQYQRQIQSEKAVAREEIERKLKGAIAEKIENETIRRYEIYFRPDNANDSAKDVRKDIEAVECRFLTYDNRAEKAKIERQEKALFSLLEGYVKNPYLASYLFAPETLSQTTRPILEDSDIDWCLESLNERQRLAVRHALSSESIFLLQGPPGTGKTQVIAEITAQLAKQGKKVLISSETHKAIDNVFERLPKIPEIRPLRLIPSHNGKETNYSPERLVDNFYRNIEESLRRQVDRYEHFSDTKEHFSDEMKQLRLDYSRLLALQKANAKIENERRSLVERINTINSEIEEIRENLTSVREALDEFTRTIKHIENYRFDDDGVKEYIIAEYRKCVEALLRSFDCFTDLTLADVRKIMTADIALVREEIRAVCGDDRIAVLESQRKDLKARLDSLRNPETDDAPEVGDPNYDEYREVRKQFIEIKKQIDVASVEGAVDVRDGILAELLSPAVLSNKELLLTVPEHITAFRIKMADIISGLREKVEHESSAYVTMQGELEEKITDKQQEVNAAKTRHAELGLNEGVTEYEELNAALRQKINRFFRDFGIVREYDSGDLAKAFDIIAEEWDKLEFDFARTQAENKVKIPMFRDICGYLSSDDILEEDRQAYTKMLFENVNVFGITCTSRERFTKAQLQDLAKYNIESVDIRMQGIDVVIIDEVSKSSFLDLLIPILYGKTIILVGDHRQLPPMYDLRHMRESDFEGLDPTVITKEINDGYTALYEECFFKTLYERVPADYRVMLTKQYRCHSHIMEVFNHFYGGSGKGLTVGRKQQDDEKQHNLTVRTDSGTTIIDPQHHIYFIDCNEKESSEEGSTSKINKQEADVVMELLARLNIAAEDLARSGRIQVDPKRRIDERPSIGVICTYGDQAGLIKKRRKGAQYKGFSGKDDEKLIISTVDDFQGDERDIIIVSMVRNPKDHRFNAEFVKQFERINVAFSRARKLLIIVGAEKFLSEQMIELPDLEGNHALDKHNYPVYKHIIETIDYLGRRWSAQDIIGG